MRKLLRPAQPFHPPSSGVDGFIADVSKRAAVATPGWWGSAQFILQSGAAYANIQLQDLTRPWRFLLQLVSTPPRSFGPQGYRPELVEGPTDNPSRHYFAFVFVSFWLPTPLATLALWTWEILSYFRYKFHWSPEDIRVGQIGVRHGRLVARYGPTVLPGLIAGELAHPGA